jgi:hypothetical protein
MGSMGVWVVFIWNGMGFDNGINQSPAQNFIFTKGHKLWECDMMVFFDIPYEMGWGFISNDGEFPSGIPSSYRDIIWNFECDGL